ncbi:MAG TPA: type VI secretion system lipoprotein TssJ [Acidisphaera sp.]|nr:type VI secretion system lipoprotein TssJ [Acidisphaera sp.]
MTRWLNVAGAFGVALLAGCSSPPPPPPPTVVNITLKTGPDVNPTPSGAAAPLALRVYQLTSAANFNAAEFFPLYNSDSATLKSDIVQRDDFLMPPGDTKTDMLQPKEPVTAIAIFGAYRDFQHATWRASTDIPPHKTTDITVTAGRNGITLKVQTQPAKPAS